MSEQPTGGILVLPLKFLSGLRDSELKRRQDFFRVFKPVRINVFDMETVVINFEKRPYTEPFTRELWSIHFYPENNMGQIEVENKPCTISTSSLESPNSNQRIESSFSNKIVDGWCKTNLELQPLDTDKRPMGLYTTLESTDETFQVRGVLSKHLHAKLCQDFNNYVMKERAQKINMVIPFASLDKISVCTILERLICSYAK
jgi:hypothetical protein